MGGVVVSVPAMTRDGVKRSCTLGNRGSEGSIDACAQRNIFTLRDLQDRHVID